MFQIGVIGSGIGISNDIKKIAYDVGAEIARKKGILICGGKGGVMESACKGCHDFNGISVGILPSISPDEANQYVAIKIPTNMGENRNFLVVQSSDILICIAGVLGTRIEANYSLKLNKTLITIPKSGGVSEEFYNKYVNNKNYRVFSAKNGIDAVNLAFSLLEKNKI